MCHKIHLDAVIGRDPQHQVVVEDVEGAVEWGNGQLGGPAEVQLVHVDGAVAGNGRPVRAVVVAADDGLDDAVTHDADVGAVSNVDVTISGDG